MTTSVPYELIIVDGGSTDQTVSLAKQYGQVYQLFNANRGAQLSYGVTKSSGEILWFLHSDSVIESTKDLLAIIEKCFSDSIYSAAFFKLKFDSAEFFYRYLAETSTLRALFLGLIFGDQGLVTTQKNYEKAGGFEPVPLMEDWRFSRRLRKIGKFKLLPFTIQTSSRRFRKGKLQTHLKMHQIKLLYLFGVSPKKLAERYYR
ncbi:transferase 2, rSAM/selenodomain-associated [Enterococcus hermanniensis]|uniref:4,4'-diaponeurosporenoate glycosyltransferase n=2 Tax=Enterococcus hermanniensis TaxID=249189 RepID=A0A1L8TQE6_9ENTE|nr:transferase 2, rSAM/selenodomain-associated [Enterococcus hermanniensis]